MDSIRVSEAPDPGSIPGEATSSFKELNFFNKRSPERLSFFPHQYN